MYTQNDEMRTRVVAINKVYKDFCGDQRENNEQHLLTMQRSVKINKRRE